MNIIKLFQILFKYYDVMCLMSKLKNLSREKMFYAEKLKKASFLSSSVYYFELFGNLYKAAYRVA